VLKWRLNIRREVLGMTKWAWAWFGFLLALDIAIPWYALTNVEKVSGAFLFWTLWVVAAIISAFIIFLGWRGVER
jgi:amino acid transporter